MLKIYKNNKTGKLYKILIENVIDATNGRETEEELICYTDDNKVFVRKTSEFFKKFYRGKIMISAMNMMR